MSAPWSSFATVVDALVQGNFADWPLKEGNRNFARPEPGPVATAPAKFHDVDFSAENNEVPTKGRTLIANGLLLGTCWIQGDAGKPLATAYMDRWQSVSDAWAAIQQSSPVLLFFAVEFGELGYVGDALAPEWAFRDFRLPFLYVSPVSADQIDLLGGLAMASQTITATGLLVKDWVGYDTTSTPVWRRVKAGEVSPSNPGGEPRCEGVVSLVGDGTATLTTGGEVKIPGHGWTVGPLFLSQVTPGAAGVAPVSGPSRRVATVIDADKLIVHGGAQEVVL
jgi:hypothetical protein